MKRALYILAWLFASGSAYAATPESVTLTNPMVADISQNAIEIRSSFNGAQLLIFGARTIPGELIIVVRGPAQNIAMRRKERIAGMWMHVEQHKYADVPLFYAIATTKPLAQIASPDILQTLGLGTEEITQAGNGKTNTLFDTALAKTMVKKHWWQPSFSSITYFGESLFKARLDMPDTLPGGDYTAEVYLFDHGTLLAMQTIPLTVYKVGFEADLVKHAKNDSLAYGLAAVWMAIFGGWLANRLFQRG